MKWVERDVPFESIQIWKMLRSAAGKGGKRRECEVDCLERDDDMLVVLSVPFCV